MAYHNGRKFYTKDTDNDRDCATIKKGGWWYANCAASNPNGPYEATQHGLYWETPDNQNKMYPKTFRMAIRGPEAA